jgi:predicted ATPase
MLKRFVASNFKSIKHLELELQPFMVFVGPNGAGKTNIVQAIDLFGELLRQGSIEPIRDLGYDEIIRREMKPARSGLTLGGTFAGRMGQLLPLVTRDRAPEGKAYPEQFEVSIRFVVRGSVQDDELHVHEEILVLRHATHELRVTLDASGTRVDNRADEELAGFTRRFLRIVSANGDTDAPLDEAVKKRIDNFRGAGRGSWLMLPRLLDPVLTRQARVTRLRLDASTLREDALTKERQLGGIGPAGEGLALALDKLRGHDNTPSDAFMALLQQLKTVYPRIEDIEPVRIQPGRLALRFKERGILEPLGQANVSDGVLHSLALLLALDPHGRAAGVVAIEEPENAIHPWPLRQIVERAQKITRRDSLIVTTHSPIVVSAIEDTHALFVVEQFDDKGTTVTPARDKEQALDAIIKESGMKLGQLWLEGGLGGVPTHE